MGIYIYKTRGVCSRSISVELEGRVIKQVRFVGGCDGNLKGLSQLVAGMDLETVIERVRDVRCENKPTSCPAQLAIALQQAWEAERKKNESRNKCDQELEGV